MTKYEEMRRLLRAYGFNGVRLAEVLNISPPTARKRLREPETLTLYDLERLNRLGHIPLEEIRQAIK